MLVPTRNRNDNRDSIAWYCLMDSLYISLNKREDLLTKKMRKIRKERPHRAFSHILRWLLVIYLPTQKRGMGVQYTFSLLLYVEHDVLMYS
jgi:hypothetical protein